MKQKLTLRSYFKLNLKKIYIEYVDFVTIVLSHIISKFEF